MNYRGPVVGVAKITPSAIDHSASNQPTPFFLRRAIELLLLSCSPRPLRRSPVPRGIAEEQYRCSRSS